MVMCVEDTPHYDRGFVAALAAGDATWRPRKGPLADCIGSGIDDTEMRSFFINFAAYCLAGDCGFIHCKPTLKPLGSCSDYYQARVPGCPDAVFIKFFVDRGCLIVSSFKDYDDG